MNIRESLKVFFDKCGIEAIETKEAFISLAKASIGKKLTIEDEAKMKEQFVDLLKIAGIMVPAAIIPGSSVLVPLVVTVAKRKGLNILPSSFNESIVFEEIDGEISIGDLVIYNTNEKEYRTIVSKISGNLIYCDTAIMAEEFTFNIKALNIKKSKALVYDANKNFIREIQKSQYKHLI